MNTASGNVCNYHEVTGDLVVALQLMQENNIECDTTLHVQGEEFHAHKLILMAMSTHFFKEFNQNPGKTHFHLENSDKSHVNMLLSYCYNKPINITNSNIFDLLYIGSEFGLLHHLKKCSEFLAANMTSQNFVGLINQAYNFDCDTLKSKCLNFFEDNTDSILNTNTDHLEREAIECVLSSKTVTGVKEADLFNMLQNWGKAYLQHIDVPDPTPELVSGAVGDLYNSIRFAEVTADDFDTYVVGKGVLSTQQELDYLRYFVNPTEERKLRLYEGQAVMPRHMKPVKQQPHEKHSSNIGNRTSEICEKDPDMYSTSASQPKSSHMSDPTKPQIKSVPECLPGPSACKEDFSNYSGSNVTGFVAAWGITVLPDSTFVVSDCHDNNVLKYTLKGRKLESTDENGIVIKKPQGLCYVHMENQYSVVVCEWQKKRLVVLNDDLDIVQNYIKTKGQPTAVAHLRSGCFAVGIPGAVHVVTVDGEVIHELSEDIGVPRGIIEGCDYLIISDNGKHKEESRLRWFNLADGESFIETAWDYIAGITLSEDGNILVCHEADEKQNIAMVDTIGVKLHEGANLKNLEKYGYSNDVAVYKDFVVIAFQDAVLIRKLKHVFPGHYGPCSVRL